MKKYLSSKKYIRTNSTSSKKLGKRKRSRKYDENRQPRSNNRAFKNKEVKFIEAEEVLAPENLCLLEKSQETLAFFNELRKDKRISKRGSKCYVKIDLSRVNKVDFSTICVLIAIIKELRSRKIFPHTTLPAHPSCLQFVIQSGLLEEVYNVKGKKFDFPENSEHLLIGSGSKRLSAEDNIELSNTAKKVVFYLTGEDRHCKRLRNILVEICGNSLEWSQTKKRQWLFGVKYEDGRVIFTITDVGRGILKSLHKKFHHKLEKIFGVKSDEDVLRGAFEGIYGSSSQMENRNLGLPLIKKSFDDGLLLNLKIITNTVVLHCDDESQTNTMSSRSEFKGTFYRWIVTAESLKNE